MKEKEKKALLWIEDNLQIIVLIVCVILGVIIRIALRNLTSGDWYGFLKGWYIEIAKNGLEKQVGDYNFPYQFMIWIMTKFPFMPPLFSYKILSCLFDVVLAIAVSLLVRDILGEAKWATYLAFSLIWLSPLVFLNSAGWAQCDSIYSSFALFSLLLFNRKKYNASMCMLGVAFAFKLQAVFVLPLFLFAYFERKEFSLTKFLLVPLSMIAVSLPSLFFGRNILDIFKVYVNQTSTYHVIAKNYPSFWLMSCPQNDLTPYKHLKLAAICFTIFILALLMCYWLKKGYKTNGINLYIMAYLVIYTCVLFLPCMHERYGYLYEILAIMLAILIPKAIPLCIGLIFISLNTYGHYLFSIDINIMTLAFVNTMIYCLSVYLLDKEMIK